MRIICKNVNYSCVLVINQQDSVSLTDYQNTNYFVDVKVTMCNKFCERFCKIEYVFIFNYLYLC